MGSLGGACVGPVVVREFGDRGFTGNRIIMVVAGPPKPVQVWRGDEQVIVLSWHHPHPQPRKGLSIRGLQPEGAHDVHFRARVILVTIELLRICEASHGVDGAVGARAPLLSAKDAAHRCVNDTGSFRPTVPNHPDADVRQIQRPENGSVGVPLARTGDNG